MLDSWIIAGTLALCSVESAVWSQLEQHASLCLSLSLLASSRFLLLSATCLLFIDRCVCHSFFLHTSYTRLHLLHAELNWLATGKCSCMWLLPLLACPAPVVLVVFRFYNYVHLLAIRIVHCRLTFRQSVKICNQALSQFCGQSSLARYNHRLCDAASSSQHCHHPAHSANQQAVCALWLKTCRKVACTLLAKIVAPLAMHS